MKVYHGALYQHLGVLWYFKCPGLSFATVHPFSFVVSILLCYFEFPLLYLPIAKCDRNLVCRLL
jgi:hypothetical protein